MKISYGLTVCNEHEEIKNLIEYLLPLIDSEDEIVVVYDKNRVTPQVMSVLEDHKERISYYEFDFKQNFLENKNFMNSQCKGDYIFQIDADEIPEEYLVKNIKLVLESNPVDLLVGPRKNLVSGLTENHTRKWNWRVNERGWVNWPDPQKRIYRNTPEIKWEGHQVHGMVEGYKTFGNLPMSEEWSIIHNKTIDRQEKQNERYQQIENTQEKKKLVIFGPWCGEFCYELSWWIPEIRQQRYTKYQDYDAIAISHEGRKILYSDFTQDYHPYPKELEDTLKYPATYGEHINGRDIIPQNLQNFARRIASSYQGKYQEVEIYMPGVMPISKDRTMSDNPYGMFKHYNASSKIIKEVKDEISFNNDLDTVALMARVRTRMGRTCYLDWNPEHWKKFVELLINDLKVNVVTIGIERKEGSSAGGSLIFEESDQLKNIIFKGPDSVERQIALLKQTKCSIYGASGTAVFPFFTQTPTFTQQTKEEGFRLKFQWERDLTNNLENIKVFDKYHNNEIYNSSPYELYEEFKEFYNKLGNIK